MARPLLSCLTQIISGAQALGAPCIDVPGCNNASTVVMAIKVMTAMAKCYCGVYFLKFNLLFVFCVFDRTDFRTSKHHSKTCICWSWQITSEDT